MLISGLQKTSMIDYPKKLSAIIFTQGCNFKCPYCHNPELNKFGSSETEFSVSLVIDFLKSRIDKLDGVVITGGEPTLHKDLPELIETIKNLGFLVKLDTNGTNYDMLQQLVLTKKIDYVAMDIKAPIEKYNEVICTNIQLDNIKKSIEFLKSDNIDYEFRTTVVKSQLAYDDFDNIGKLISGCKRYYLQKFLPTKTLNPNYKNAETYTTEEFESIIKNLKKYMNIVELR